MYSAGGPIRLGSLSLLSESCSGKAAHGRRDQIYSPSWAVPMPLSFFGEPQLTTPEPAENLAKRPVPLGRNERRVLGVLVEKAKTTPDNYPLSIASIVAGANQKSNRSPLMQLDEDDVQMALDNLRAVGAAREVQGISRVAKFRHVAYEWLGVDSAGAAIMTELLLRGPQTIGELRTRASRMHELPDLEMVSGAVATLQASGLIQSLTPPGRGQTFAHTLYPPDEQRYLSAKVAAQDRAGEENDNESSHPVVTANSVVHESRLAAVESRLDELQLRLEELESRLKTS